jgi:hypothetical protein
LAGTKRDRIDEERADPGCLILSSWRGLLVIVHYWFFVRGAEDLCRTREEMIEAKIK